MSDLEELLYGVAEGSVPIRVAKDRIEQEMNVMSDDRCDLQKLCQAIVDHTGGDGFWIGEILLDTIKRETGYKYEPAVYQDDAGGGK